MDKDIKFPFFFSKSEQDTVVDYKSLLAVDSGKEKPTRWSLTVKAGSSWDAAQDSTPQGLPQLNQIPVCLLVKRKKKGTGVTEKEDIHAKSFDTQHYTGRIHNLSKLWRLWWISRK